MTKKHEPDKLPVTPDAPKAEPNLADNVKVKAGICCSASMDG
ncbi:MAG: hypothetical protein QMC17_07420 [Paracoccaceae bacterium]|jgi:hypothetical protein